MNSYFMAGLLAIVAAGAAAALLSKPRSRHIELMGWTGIVVLVSTWIGKPIVEDALGEHGVWFLTLYIVVIVMSLFSLGGAIVSVVRRLRNTEVVDLEWPHA